MVVGDIPALPRGNGEGPSDRGSGGIASVPSLGGLNCDRSDAGNRDRVAGNGGQTRNHAVGKRETGIGRADEYERRIVSRAIRDCGEGDCLGGETADDRPLVEVQLADVGVGSIAIVRRDVEPVVTVGG